MTVPPKEELDKLVEEGPVWIKLYDGMNFCLIDVFDNCYEAKFLLCSPKSRVYNIKYKDITEVYEDYL